MTKRYKFLTIILSCVFVGIFILWINQVLGIETDVWWHLKFGQEILQGRHIDGVDTWSWVTASDGAPLVWVQHEWLFAVVLAVLNYIPGGMYIPAILGHSILIAYFLTRLLPKFKTPKQVWCGVFGIVLGIIFTINPSSRPHSLGFLCVVALMDRIWKFEESKNLKSLFIVPVILVVWTNIWGGTVLLALAMLGTCLLQEFVLMLRKQPNKFPELLGIYGVAGLSCFITPAGWRSVFYRFFNSADQSLVSEWAPLKFLDPQAVWVLLAIVVLVIFRNKLRLFEWCMSAGFLLLAAMWVRFCSLPLLLVLFIGIYHWDSEVGEIDLSETYKSLWTVLISIAMFFAVVSGVSSVKLDSAAVWNPVSDELLTTIKQTAPERLYTEMDSGYLIYNDIPVFVDSRADPFAEFYTETLKVSVGIEPFSQLNQKWDFDYAIIRKTSEIVDQFSEYQLFAEDKLWCFYKLS